MYIRAYNAYKSKYVISQIFLELINKVNKPN